MTTTTSSSTEIRSTTIDLGEHQLYVNEVGDSGSPTIVWLHGSGPGVSAQSNWKQLITSMPEYHHIAPDVLGFGSSSHPDPAPVGMPAFTRLRAEVILQLLDKLGIENAHMVGNSMGGMILLDLLSFAPERVNRIVLMGSGGSPESPTKQLGQMVMYYENPGPESMRELLKNFVYDTTTFAGRLDEIAESRAREAARPEVRRSHLATFDFSGGSVKFEPEQLAGYPHEALVVHGREDQLIPIGAAVYLSTHLPNAQLHVLPHAGHWVQIEAVDRFRALANLFFGEEDSGMPA